LSATPTSSKSATPIRAARPPKPSVDSDDDVNVSHINVNDYVDDDEIPAHLLTTDEDGVPPAYPGGEDSNGLPSPPANVSRQPSRAAPMPLRWRSAVLRFIVVLDQMVDLAPKHWMRWDQFFSVLQNFAALGSAERSVLSVCNMTSRLAWLLASQQLKDGKTIMLELGNRHVSPNYAPVMNTLVLLVRGMGTLTGMPPTCLADSGPYERSRYVAFSF
jgi:hypothetical protein